MLRSERQSKRTKRNRNKEEKPWHPRGDMLIPPHHVEASKKSYSRKKEKFNWKDLNNDQHD